MELLLAYPFCGTVIDSHAAVGSRLCAIQVELDDEMFVIAVQAEAVRELHIRYCNYDPYNVYAYVSHIVLCYITFSSMTLYPISFDYI